MPNSMTLWGWSADTGIEGVIATNTTISREGLQMPGAQVEAVGAGGLSGAPVRKRSTRGGSVICATAGTLPSLA